MDAAKTMLPLRNGRRVNVWGGNPGVWGVLLDLWPTGDRGSSARSRVPRLLVAI